VVAALVAQGHRLHTFSVAFRERQFDESEQARLVARRFGTEHTELLLEPAQMLADYDQAVAAYDQPSIDGVNTYFISQAVRRAGIKVALSGLGGDELFAGYPYFRRLARLEHRGVRWLAGVAYQVLRRISPRSIRTIKLGALLQGEPSRLARYVVCRQVMAPAQRDALYPHRPAADPVPLPGVLAEELADQAAGLDAINAHSLLECSLYMANMLLRDLDQMSMAHALEVREPLLDHLLVEAVAAVPGPLKLAPGHAGRVKALLLDALPDKLPSAVHQRPKMGFVLPWERWLRGELRSWVGTALTDREALAAAGFEAPAVEKLWNDFLAGRPGTRYTDVLCLAHLLHWVKRHGLAVAD
jgi:asparagine synthase (glutamine-hydrolysing)